MFSVSSTEFAGLPEFVEKISGGQNNANLDSDTPSGFDSLRSWCSDQGMVVHYSKTSSGLFYVLKYDRAKLTDDQYPSLGRFRSVVFDKHGKICCAAPPKMLKLSDELLSVNVNCAGGYLWAEEYVEGVMVNLFHNDGKWFVATKSCVGEVSYEYLSETTATATATATASTLEVDGSTASDATATVPSTEFKRLPIQEILRRRICDTLSLLTNGLTGVSTQYCYSFVLQHPKNQIVNEITTPKLFLIGAYELSENGSNGVNVVRIDRDIFTKLSFQGSVLHTPSGLTCVADENDHTVATFTPNTVADYCKMYASPETIGAALPGVVFRDGDTGFCYKKRNPKYESVKKRKGMEQKLLSQYLFLRKDRAIDEYLKYHPQHNRTFNDFREHLHEYTSRLYSAYIDHYVKKNAKPLKEYDRELRTHMYKLHYDVFLATMKEVGAFVTKHTVINYVNNLAPAQQLACLNARPMSTSTQPSRDTAPVLGDAPTPTSSRFIPRGGYSRGPSQDRGQGRSQGQGQGQGQHSRFEGRGSETLASRGGFRTRRGTSYSNAPTLTVQIPNDNERVRGVKSATPGLVKVQNQFASLDADNDA